MSRVALGVDHVGIVGPDLTVLADDFRALGFLVTPRAEHAGGRTGNHCVMFADAYLELIGTMPSGASATLEGFLARHTGAHTLAFAIDDPQAVVARLARAGFQGLAPYDTERALDDADPASARVAFTLITPPDPPFSRAHLIHHRTRATLFAQAASGHANRVVGLGGLVIRAEVPAEVAAWLSRLTGRAVVVEVDGALRVDMPGPTLSVRATEGPAIIAEITLITDDANRSTRAILARNGIAHREEAASLVMTHHDLTIRFAPRPDGAAR